MPLISGAALGIKTPLQYITQEQNERFLRNPNNQVGNNPQRVSAPTTPLDAYTTATRGVICEVGQESNVDRILIFQFNPETITDAKANNYNSRSYTGFTFNDHVWASGGERSISFKLNFEATAAVNTPLFGKNPTYGDSQVSTLLTYFPRGTLDMTDLLLSFTYPSQEDKHAPRFSNGGFIPAPKFMPPPRLIFSYGEYYLEGVITDVTITHTQVRADLIPERSEAEIIFKVHEQTQIKYKPIQGVSSFRDGLPIAGPDNSSTQGVGGGIA